MVAADHVLSVVLLTTSTDYIPPWLDLLAEEANTALFTATPANIHDQLALDMPDALVFITDNDEYIDCIQTVHDEYEDRPAIILCAEHAPGGQFDQLVDLVIPPEYHTVISYQIRQAIRQHKHLKVLESEMAGLRRSQANHQKAIADIEALKNAVVHNVSHELNTPLLQVKSAVALIAEDIKNNTLVDYATRATARLEAAVKNITQLAASLNAMPISPLLIGDIIDSALRDLRRTWEHKEHFDRIHVMLDEKLPPALGDRHGISIVLQQLIDNALKFSEREVEVKACRHGSCIKIAVRDYGIGIDQDEIAKIFDSFYKVDPKTTRNFNGTGVGLANVRLILERHGVEIEVYSVKGQGSTFAFELPIANLEK